MTQKTIKKPVTKKSTKIEDKFLIIEHDNYTINIINSSNLQENLKKIEDRGYGIYNVKVFDIKKLKLFDVKKTSIFNLVEIKK